MPLAVLIFIKLLWVYRNLLLRNTFLDIFEELILILRLLSFFNLLLVFLDLFGHFLGDLLGLLVGWLEVLNRKLCCLLSNLEPC